MVRKPATMGSDIRIRLGDLVDFLLAATEACARNKCRLLLRQNSETDFALEELNVGQKNVDSVPENIANQLVRPLFEFEQVFERYLLCDIVGDRVA